jgi:hypothetical protein
VKVVKLISAEAHQQELEHQEYLEENHVCSVCSCDYTEDEGGTVGYIGILPVAFCPTCLAGIIDMAQQYLGVEDQ